MEKKTPTPRHKKENYFFTDQISNYIKRYENLPCSIFNSEEDNNEVTCINKGSQKVFIYIGSPKKKEINDGSIDNLYCSVELYAYFKMQILVQANST